MIKSIGYAAQSAHWPLERWEFERTEPAPNELLIEILWSGICHSDIHDARNEWRQSIYPMVPGHEIIGRVAKIGSEVRLFKVGDTVGVGPMVGSCGVCTMCRNDLEPYCVQGFVSTYNSVDKKTGKVTYGGFSNNIVVPEHFVVRVPDAFKKDDLAAVAPLLCAGITTYSPLLHWGVGKGSMVGVVGIGGLGHVAVKIAHALGAQVIAFTSSKTKIDDATRLGAAAAVLNTDSAQMATYKNSLNFILHTLPVADDLIKYLDLLTFDGTMCLVGLPPAFNPGFHPVSLIFKRSQLAGSLIGGMHETERMLNFCAQHKITADVEIIAPANINEAFDRVVSKDARYRCVLDMQAI